MLIPKSINPFSSASNNNDTGFGTNANNYGGRFINRDGSYNLRKQGVSFRKRFSLFHTMLNMPLWKFITVIVSFFLVINLIYTSLYIAIGINDFEGVIGNTTWQKFKELYFFSCESFTTVGYGRVNPIGDGVNIVAAFEAMSGFLSFAVATGLIYGRFAKPKSFIDFSDHALVGPFRGKTAFMFRIASYKDNHNVTDAKLRVTLSILDKEKENSEYKFYDLALERARIDTLMMNWTVVHPIDEKSPLLGLTAEEYSLYDVEIYVMLTGFDDVYNTNVIQRSSYTYDEIKFNAKFVPMYHESEDGKTTILELDKLNSYTTIN